MPRRSASVGWGATQRAPAIWDPFSPRNVMSCTGSALTPRFCALALAAKKLRQMAIAAPLMKHRRRKEMDMSEEVVRGKRPGSRPEIVSPRGSRTHSQALTSPRVAKFNSKTLSSQDVRVAVVGFREREPASQASNKTRGLVPDPGHRGAKRNRTADLFIANEALYQLSYSPCAGRKYTQREGMAENALTFLSELRRRSTN